MGLVGSNDGTGFCVNYLYPFSSSILESKPTSISWISTQPEITSLSGIQQCYAMGSYETPTTSKCLSLSSHCPFLVVDYTSCLEVVHPLSSLCFVGWDFPFPTSAVRGSETQISVSFV